MTTQSNNGDGAHAVFEEVMKRVRPEIRERFLKSKIDLEKRFGEHDEVIALALHLDNFAALISDLSSGTLPPVEDSQAILDNRRLLIENLNTAKEIQRISQDNRLSATVIGNAARWKILCIAVGSFVGGAFILLVLELVCKFHLWPR